MKTSFALGALLACMAATALAQAPVPAAPVDSQSFRQMALAGDAFEMASSRLAIERTRNPRVLAYAQTMLRDHAATSQALNGGRPIYGAGGEIIGGTVTGALAGAGIGALVGGPVGAAVGAGIGGATGATTSAAAANPGGAGGTVTGTLAGAGVGAVVGGPVGAAVGAGVGATAGAAANAPIQTAVPLDARKAGMLNQLAATSGPAFDRLYGSAQRMAHREAIGLYSTYAQTGIDPALVSFAQSALPHLQQHAAAARRLPGR
jgi:predicted outer membrane protein